MDSDTQKLIERLADVPTDVIEESYRLGLIESDRRIATNLAQGEIGIVSLIERAKKQYIERMENILEARDNDED